MDRTDREVPLLRKLTEARIACANSAHEFTKIENLSTDLNVADDEFAAVALDIHLRCGAGAKEATVVHDILTAFLTEGQSPDWQWMEVEVRCENAASAANDISTLIGQLAAGSHHNSELGVKQIKRRAELLKPQLDGLKETLQHLQAEILREAQMQQRDFNATEPTDS